MRFALFAAPPPLFPTHRRTFTVHPRRSNLAVHPRRPLPSLHLTMVAPSDPPVLVTGATGFLGSHLTAALRGAGFAVHTLSRTVPSKPDPFHHLCDLTNPGEILPAILAQHNWHAIVHLAGLVSYTARDLAAMRALNVDATAALLHAITQHCPSTKFVFCSSVAAVGSNASPSDPPLTEHSPWDESLADVAYVRTKHEAEVLVSDAARKHSLRTVSLCPSNVFGPGDGQKPSRRTQVRAANGKARLYTNGGVSIVHIDVVVAAFLAAVRTSPDDDLWRGTRWLLTGDNITVRNMLALCAASGGNARHAPWLRLPDWILIIVCWIAERLGSKSMAMDRFIVATRYHWFDGRAARDRFHLPHIPAHRAIADSVAWMREQGLVRPRQ